MTDYTKLMAELRAICINGEDCQCPQRRAAAAIAKLAELHRIDEMCMNSRGMEIDRQRERAEAAEANLAEKLEAAELLINEHESVQVAQNRKLAAVEAALKQMSAMAPPNDWEYYEVFDGYIGYPGYGRDDPAYVEEPDTSNNGDMLDFGAAVGRRQLAKIARAALSQSEDGE